VAVKVRKAVVPEPADCAGEEVGGEAHLEGDARSVGGVEGWWGGA
jgi:hypothetical protein